MKKREGMSLVSVIIAAGILSGIILTVMVLMDNSMKQQKFIQGKEYSQDMVRSIGLYLTDSKSCTHTMIGISPTSSDRINEIKDENNNTVYSIPAQFDRGTKILKKIFVDTFAPDNLTQSGILNLGLSFEILIGKQKQQSKSIYPIFVELFKSSDPEVLAGTYAAGSIKTCYADKSQTITESRRKSCEDLGGTYNLDSTPACTLPLDSRIHIVTATCDDGEKNGGARLHEYWCTNSSPPHWLNESNCVLGMQRLVQNDNDGYDPDPIDYAFCRWSGNRIYYGIYTDGDDHENIARNDGSRMAACIAICFEGINSITL